MLQEAQAKDNIVQLKAEIANLTRLAEAGSALSSGEEAALNELMKQKEELTRERDAQVSSVTACADTEKLSKPAAWCCAWQRRLRDHHHAVPQMLSSDCNSAGSVLSFRQPGA